MEHLLSEQVMADAPPRPPVKRARPQNALVRKLHHLRPLLWIGPALALILVVVIWPVVVMVQTSFKDISPDGFDLGSAGGKNFSDLFSEPALTGVIVRTVIWTVVVVLVTMVISLLLAQLFNQKFPGRKVTRWALIAPWAASVMMTALIFRWALESKYGVINLILHKLGLITLGSSRADWLGNPTTALMWMMLVGVFVSLPFTTYAILAGLQTIPEDVYEAARIDGADKRRIYRSITLPLLRPSLIVATLINVINVFNSFPVIWEMTRGGPGYQTSTTTTFMFILKQSYIGESAAMSVINFALVIVIVLVFLKLTKWKDQVSA